MFYFALDFDKLSESYVWEQCEKCSKTLGSEIEKFLALVREKGIIE